MQALYFQRLRGPRTQAAVIRRLRGGGVPQGVALIAAAQVAIAGDGIEQFSGYNRRGSKDSQLR